MKVEDGTPNDLDLDNQEHDEDDLDLGLDNQPEGDDEDEDGDNQPEGEDEQHDDFSIEIEGEEPVRENNVVRELRETARRQARELAQLRAAQAPPKVELGPKPDLWEDCDGDAELFEQQLLAWNNRKQQVEEQGKASEREAEQQAEAWNKVEAGYTSKVAALGVPNFRKHEERVIQTLDDRLVRAIKFYMNDPAKVIAALGTNPRLLERIAGETDAVKALFQLRDVEGKINVKRKPPQPDSGTIPRGTGSVASGGTGKQLAKLEAAAEKSGDRSELIRFKRQLAAKGK